MDHEAPEAAASVAAVREEVEALLRCALRNIEADLVHSGLPRDIRVRAVSVEIESPRSKLHHTYEVRP
jgi:hypothetical protein